ncbi:MAG: hypothetical protein WDW38_009130 [Sanguina aurantia]
MARLGAGLPSRRDAQRAVRSRVSDSEGARLTRHAPNTLYVQHQTAADAGLISKRLPSKQDGNACPARHEVRECGGAGLARALQCNVPAMRPPPALVGAWHV